MSASGQALREKMHYAYILENDKGRHYIGSCEDVEQRLKKHNQNSVRSTKNKGPFKVVYKKEFDTRTEARIIENQIKRRKDSGYLQKLIDEYATPSSSLV